MVLEPTTRPEAKADTLTEDTSYGPIGVDGKDSVADTLRSAGA